MADKLEHLRRADGAQDSDTAACPRTAWCAEAKSTKTAWAGAPSRRGLPQHAQKLFS